MSTTCDNYKLSFFPRAIVDWNRLTNEIIMIEDMERFKAAVAAKLLLLPIQNSISKLATAEHIDSKISELRTHVEGKLKEQDDRIEKINEKIEKMEGYISFMENALDQQNRNL